MKKYWILILASLLVLTLSACGNSSGSASTYGESQKNQQTQTNSSSDKASADKAADLAKSITSENAEAHGICGADMEWYYKDNVMVLRGTGATVDYEEGWGKAKDLPWDDYVEQISRIIVEEGCTGLGNHLFNGVTNLSSVYLPDSLEELGRYSFHNCKNLEKVYFGTGLNIIKGDAFSGCGKLKDIDIPDGVLRISDWAFAECKSLENVKLPDTVTVIGSFAFGQCTNLKSINIPASIVEFGHDSKLSYGGNSSPFSGCPNLESIDCQSPNFEFEDDVLVNKEEKAIVFCSSNKSGVYTIPDDIETLYGGAFEACDKITDIIVPANVKYLGRSRPKDVKSITFLGEAVEGTTGSTNGFVEDVCQGTSETLTVYYNGSSFEKTINLLSNFDITWVKQ